MTDSNSCDLQELAVFGIRLESRLGRFTVGSQEFPQDDPMFLLQWHLSEVLK